MEINIKLKIDEESVKAIEKALGEGKKVRIKISNFNVELVVGPDTKEEIVYTAKLE